MKFEQLLPILSAELQLGDLVLDANNQITMEYDGYWKVTYELDSVNDEVLFFLPVPNLSTDLMSSHGVFEKLHQRFVFGKNSFGFSLSFLEEKQCAVLWRRYRNDFHDGEEIKLITNHLVKLGMILDDQIQEFVELQNADEDRCDEASQATGSSLDNQSFGLRV